MEDEGKSHEDRLSRSENHSPVVGGVQDSACSVVNVPVGSAFACLVQFDVSLFCDSKRDVGREALRC